MILLDTNVISEVMRPRPQATVLEWLNRQPTENLYLSTVTIAEISYGLHSMPGGKRSRILKDRFDLFVRAGFVQRILSFDKRSALLYGELMGRRRKSGRSMSVLDGQIAAIAKANGCAIATRNVRDFEGSGLDIFDPFEA